MNNIDLGPYSNTTSLKSSGQIVDMRTDVYVLGLAVSNFCHKHNEFFKQQKEDTIKAFNECSEKLKFTTGNKKKVNADYKAKLKIIRKSYDNSRKRVQEEFKEFRKTTEYLIKGAEELELIDKEEVKNYKKELGTFEKETKNAEKNFKNETKSVAYRNLLSIFQT